MANKDFFDTRPLEERINETEKKMKQMLEILEPQLRAKEVYTTACKLTNLIFENKYLLYGIKNNEKLHNELLILLNFTKDILCKQIYPTRKTFVSRDDAEKYCFKINENGELIY